MKDKLLHSRLLQVKKKKQHINKSQKKRVSGRHVYILDVLMENETDLSLLP